MNALLCYIVGSNAVAAALPSYIVLARCGAALSHDKCESVADKPTDSREEPI